MREVQLETDAEEFAEWVAFQSIDPSDELRADIRSAIVAYTVANVFRGPKSPSIKFEDFLPFMPKKRVPRRKRTPAEMETELLGWAKRVARRHGTRKA